MSSAAQEQPPEPADGGPEPGVHSAHITGAHITGRVVSASAVVAATPDQLFALLADPHRHHELDGSGSVRGAVSGLRRLALGHRFGMRMRVGLPYQTMNKVVELSPTAASRGATSRGPSGATSWNRSTAARWSPRPSTTAAPPSPAGWSWWLPGAQRRSIAAALRRLQELFPAPLTDQPHSPVTW